MKLIKVEKDGSKIEIDTKFDWGYKKDIDYVNHLLLENGQLKLNIKVLMLIVDVLAKQVVKSSKEVFPLKFLMEKEEVGKDEEMSKIVNLLTESGIQVFYM